MLIAQAKSLFCVTAPDFLPHNFFFFALNQINEANDCIDTAPFFAMLVHGKFICYESTNGKNRCMCVVKKTKSNVIAQCIQRYLVYPVHYKFIYFR